MSSTQANGKSTKGGKPGGAAATAGKGKSSSTTAAAGKTGSASGKAAATPAVSDISALEPLTEWSTSSKPDRDTYNVEQDQIKSLIAVKQAQLDKIKQKIQDSTGQGPAAERRKALRNEQAELRGKTAGRKDDRNSALNQIKTLNEGIQKKIKDMQSAKSKTSYKSVAEIDNRIKDLERQVESGTMRLVEEKRALSEISDLRRSKKTFDTFGSAQESIDSDKAKVEALKTKLDDPEYKALQDRYTAIQDELAEINKGMDETSSQRDKLFEERNGLNAQVNELWNRKKDSAASFKEANDKYYTKMNEDRQKRHERQQAERRQYEESKRKEINERLLEEAKAPAFEREIEDCSTLIAYFSRFASGASSVPEPALSTVPSSTSSGPKGVPALELRKVENDMPEGALLSKNKQSNDPLDELFGGMGKGKKGGKGKKTTPAASTTESSANQMPNIPFQTVAALLQFNISAPLSKDDVPKTIDALKEKKKYFEDNQDRVTKERTEAAEQRIAAAEQKAQAATPSATAATLAAGDDKEEDKTADAVEDAPEAKDVKVDEVAEQVDALKVDDEKEEGELDE